MKWKMVRLELASNWEFPRGSVGRSYLIRMPLNDDGAIDAPALDSLPARATVRRYWPNQADMAGYLVRTPVGYAIRYELSAAMLSGDPQTNGSTDHRLFQFGADTIRIGEEIFLTEPDGNQARFRIVSMQ